MPFLTIVWCRDADAVRNVRGLVDVAKERDVDAGRIVGVFNYPRNGRESCPGASCVPHRRAKGWTRNKLGVMVCGNCMLPHRDLRKRLIGALFDYLGANLVNRVAPTAFKTPDGYGSRQRDQQPSQ